LWILQDPAWCALNRWPNSLSWNQLQVGNTPTDIHTLDIKIFSSKSLSQILLVSYGDTVLRHIAVSSDSEWKIRHGTVFCRAVLKSRILFFRMSHHFVSLVAKKHRRVWWFSTSKG
jgi:hypothetical protein